LVVDKLYEGDWVSISHTGSGLTRGGRSQDLGHYWRRAIGLPRRPCVVEIILKAGQAPDPRYGQGSALRYAIRHKLHVSVRTTRFLWPFAAKYLRASGAGERAAANHLAYANYRWRDHEIDQHDKADFD
jgi:hypothetical protein